MGLNGNRSLRKKLNRMETKLDRGTSTAVRRGSAAIVSSMKRRVVFNDAVASTELFRGIQHRVGAGGPGVSRRIIESTAPYSGFVEFGTGPKHRINPYTNQYRKPRFSGSLVAALTEWAAMKPSLQTDNPGAVGYAVALSISGEAEGSIGGTEPQSFFFPAWDAGKPGLMSKVEGRVEKAVRFS